MNVPTVESALYPQDEPEAGEVLQATTGISDTQSESVVSTEQAEVPSLEAMSLECHVLSRSPALVTHQTQGAW